MNANKFIVVLVGLVVAVDTVAQTYNHDAPVMNQFTIGEIGAGSFTPDVYYDLMHKNYRNGAMTTNKQVFRTQMALTLYQEVNHAEEIDSALTERMRVENWNILDRTPSVTDLSYQVEKNKIENKMKIYKKNVERITLEGGKPKDYKAWLMRYDALTQGLEAIRNAYMPMGKRKEQYLAIYQDIIQQNKELTEFIMFLRSQKQTKKWLNERVFITKTQTGIIARSAHGRWKYAMGSASSLGNQGGQSADGRFDDIRYGE